MAKKWLSLKGNKFKGSYHSYVAEIKCLVLTNKFDKEY